MTHALPPMRLLTLLLVSSGLYALGAVGLVRALAPGRFRTTASRRRQWAWTLGAMAAVVVTEVLGRRLAPYGGGAWRVILGVERVTCLGTLIAALLVAPVAITSRPVTWLAERLLTRWRRRTVAPAQQPVTVTVDVASGAITRREALVQATALAACGTVVTGAVVGNRNRHEALAVTEVTLVIPDLPPSLEGATLVQLTDLHIGVFTGAPELDHLVEIVRRLRPDAVVLTGDVMDNNPRHIPAGMRALGRLRARLGVYGILGNHDHVTGGAHVARGMAAVGIRPLVNASVLLAPGGGEPLILAGVDDVVARRLGPGRGPDLPRALRGTPRGAPCVLLAHNPVLFDEFAGRVAVQLSGHTHGGQMNVGGVARWLMPYVAGRYTRAGSTLYVSRGIGVTGAPVRLAAAPEITRIALTARAVGA